ncbi:MAG: patatin-like phospholipase family protein, partial [Bacteroidia bacterium]
DSLLKPKLIVFNCSGGGLRSALWTMRTMQHIDSVTGGNLMKSTALICGSSGGMLGAAYMRELWLRQQNNNSENCSDPKHLRAISSDILNPMSVSIAVNDWFLPLRSVTVNNQRFSRNRAFEFEQQLLRNTDSIFDKSLSEYREDERSARIPMMVFAPTIAADGRKLVISSQPVSWLTQEQPGKNVSYQPLPDGVEFSRFFEKQGAADVRFSSVLRMNATFPYITPLTELPSNPVIEVFDAGMRDNFGTDNALLFLHTFRKWIEENTSGVIIVQTRDRNKVRNPQPQRKTTIAASFSRPLNSFYGNLFSVQNYNQNRQLDYASSWLNCPLNVIDFELEHATREPIALSWHLTQREKLQVISSVSLPENKTATARFTEIYFGRNASQKENTE